MKFQNYTPFPAMGWPTADNKNNNYLSMVVRVKYVFDTVNKDGFWSLKLDPNQGELFGKDMFYDEDDIIHSSVRFESDYVAYKPHADFIINAYAHSTVPLRKWRCGVKVLRPIEHKEVTHETLVEKWLTVRGERYIQDDVIGFSFTKSKESEKVAIRYENANGGTVDNPKFDPEDKEVRKQHLIYAAYNPIGVGVAHKVLFQKDEKLRAPQIESMTEDLDKPNMPYLPQGFGCIGRSWKPRITYAGTFDDAWIKEKHPIMPDDYKEQYNNAAHPDLQLKSYFEPHDKIVLHNLIKDRYQQSFELPNFHFKGTTETFFKPQEFYLNIDTVIVDVLEDDMKKNAVYVSYRTRIPSSKNIEECKLNMIVPQDYLGATHG